MGLEQSFNNELSTNKAESNAKSWGEILKTQQKINDTLSDLKGVENQQSVADEKEAAALLKSVETDSSETSKEVMGSKEKTPLSEKPMAELVQNISFSEKVVAFFSKNTEPSSKQNFAQMNNIMDETSAQLGPSSMNGFDAVA